jgi:hypothetical protein
MKGEMGANFLFFGRKCEGGFKWVVRVGREEILFSSPGKRERLLIRRPAPAIVSLLGPHVSNTTLHLHFLVFRQHYRSENFQLAERAKKSRPGKSLGC